MSENTQQNSILDSLRNQAQQGGIDPNAHTQDGGASTAGTGARSEFAAPAAPSKKDIKSIIESIDETVADRRTQNQNECKFIGFVAKGPHRGKYTRDELGHATLECVTATSEFLGKQKPVRVPDNANYQVDGVAIQMPNGKIEYILQKKLVDWLMTETWGGVSESDEGKSIYLTQPKKPDADGNLRPLRVNYSGASKYKDEDVIKSYEPLVENGVPVTKVESIPLDTEKTYPKGTTRETIRGQVQFPVFKRKEGFESLGDISAKGTTSRKLTNAVAIEDAKVTYATLYSHYQREQGQ